jgi:hypothetical protein
VWAVYGAVGVGGVGVGGFRVLTIGLISSLRVWFNKK